MSLNEHNYDRVIRVVIALMLFVGAALSGVWLLAIPGVILLATAVIGFCPIYAMIGFSPKPKADTEA